MAYWSVRFSIFGTDSGDTDLSYRQILVTEGIRRQRLELAI